MVCRTKKKMLVLYLWCRNEVRSKCGVSMNLQQARRTLGITPEDDKAAIKKKYRHLMGQFHPDAQVGENALDSIRRAQEINEAYDFLRKNMPEESLEKADKNTTSSRKQHGKLLTASLKALFHFHPGRSDESHMAAPP